MTRTLCPNPVPHRSGRRFLPVLAAFAWAVALHVALAAGLAGYSGTTQQVHAPPHGFKMVQSPGNGAAEETALEDSSSDLNAPPRDTAAPTSRPSTDPPAPETRPESFTARPHTPSSQSQEPAEPKVVGPAGPLKHRVTRPSPGTSAEDGKPRRPEADPATPSATETSAGDSGPGEPPKPPEPETDQTARRAGNGSDYRPPGTPAGYRSNPSPRYPAQARRRHLEGVVVLKVRVSSKGSPTQVTVASSSGHAVLDRAARRAVRGWSFRPANRGGQAVAGTVNVPIHFRLAGR